ncbi:MAG: alpha/beta fold hydrolase, partial [Gordonia polyisoprenivorans]|nr:alpha/beta fold hydrolase [Gordonia polyisoprenivorans]
MRIGFMPDGEVYPFRSSWFASSSGRVHYVDEGDGTPILFCHGSPTWSFLYRRVITGLRDRYRCIALDHMGFGLSERPSDFGFTIAELTEVLGELVDHLDLDGFVVVGHDWGGPIGVGAAVPRAERVRGLVLCNTALWPIDAMPNRAFSAVMSSRPCQRRILDNNLLVEKFLIAGLGDVLTPLEADHYRQVQPNRDARVALGVMPREIRAAREWLCRLEREIPGALGGKPAIAVWGMRDVVFRPRGCLPRIQRDFADTEVIEVPRAGHFVPEEAPDEIVTAISRRF